MSFSKNKIDPQYDILVGHGAFGVDYVPKAKRAKVIDGKVYVCKTHELEPGKAKTILLDRFNVAVFRTGDEFYAIKDACPHAEYPLSRSPLVSPYVVMCNSHNWRFDIRDGRCVRIGKCGHAGRALRARVFPVEIRDDEVWVAIQNKPEEPVSIVADTEDSFQEPKIKAEV